MLTQILALEKQLSNNVPLDESKPPPIGQHELARAIAELNNTKNFVSGLKTSLELLRKDVADHQETVEHTTARIREQDDQSLAFFKKMQANEFAYQVCAKIAIFVLSVRFRVVPLVSVLPLFLENVRC